MATYQDEEGEGFPSPQARSDWWNRELDKILDDLRDLHVVLDAGDKVQVPTSAGETDPSHKSISPH